MKNKIKNTAMILLAIVGLIAPFFDHWDAAAICATWIYVLLLEIDNDRLSRQITDLYNECEKFKKK